jgi:hypothetical protein
MGTGSGIAMGSGVVMGSTTDLIVGFSHRLVGAG